VYRIKETYTIDEDHMGNRLDSNKTLNRLFGSDEFGCIYLPSRYSNIRIERVFAGQRGDCGHCFPHGLETASATCKKNFRSWKNSRRTQYRS
jgi:hypothetical protein